MVRVGHQKLGAVISNPALRKWGGIILLILFIKSVHCSLEDSPWRVRIENSVAHVYNAQEFHEALVLAERDEQDISTILLEKSFAIRGAVWSPRIVISKDLTIAGVNPGIQISVTKSTTILEIQSGTISIQGFRFWPVDDGVYEHLTEGWQSAPAWFELGANAAAHFENVVWDMGSRFRLTNRPVHIDPSQPEFVEEVKETDEAVVFVRVVMPPCTFKNARFRHKASAATYNTVAVSPLNSKVDSREELLEVLEQAYGTESTHVNIRINKDIGFSTSHTNSVEIFKSVSITQSENAVLWLTLDSRPEFLTVLPQGRVHFEKVAVGLSRDNLQNYQNQGGLAHWFPMIHFPEEPLRARCLVSFRESSILFDSCKSVEKLDRMLTSSYVTEVVRTRKDGIFVHRFIGSGICMDAVMLTCKESLHKTFLEFRQTEDHPASELMHLEEKERNGVKRDRILLYTILVFGGLLFVSMLAFLAHWGNFGLPKYIDRKVRNLSRKHITPPERVDTGCFVIVSVSSDGSGESKASEDLSCVPDLASTEDQSTTHERGLVDPSMWSSGVELAGLHEEDVVEIEHFVGHGGFGVVYKGRWKGQPVAVKTLVFEQSNTSLGTECPIKQRAILEAGIGSIVNHSNIVQTYTYTFETPGVESLTNQDPSQSKMYMVQEYCEMGSLRMAMEQDLFVCAGTEKPNIQHILQVAKDVSQGMDYLHQRNIIHGDLTSKNILLRATDNPPHNTIAKICDFGLSVKLRPADSQLANCKVGTPLYMAPEVGKYGILSKKADVYSFGIVLWEMYRRSLKSSHWGNCNGIMEFPIECPLSFALLICWCLSPRPTDRPDFDLVLGIVNMMAPKVGVPEFDQKRGTKRINRKLVSKMRVLNPQQIKEFLLEGAVPSRPCLSKEVSFPRDDQYAYCLTLKTTSQGKNDALSMGWRMYTNSLCTVPLGPVLLKQPSESMEDCEMPPPDSARSRMQLDAKIANCPQPLLEHSLSVRTSDTEAMVAWVNWLTSMDAPPQELKGLTSMSAGSQNQSVVPKEAQSPWRSKSLSTALEKMIFSHKD